MSNLVNFFVVLFFLGGLFLWISCRKTVEFRDSDKNKIEAKVVGQDNNSWRFEIVKTDKGLENLSFVKQNIAFASNSSNFVTSFYKSTDDGRSWNKISTLENYYVNNIFFYTPTEGFALVHKVSSSQPKDSDKNCILKTNDGGITWDKILSSDINSFSKIILNNNGIGVVVGRKSPSTFEANNLVLLTADFGKTWGEVSESLNQLVKETNAQVSDYLADAIISNDKIIVLSICGRIAQTIDFGNSWELVSELNDELPQTLIQHFGVLEKEKFWLSGAANSIEGTWGLIAINKSKSNWERYKLDDYYFSDIRFLTDNEIIAAGFLISRNNLRGISKEDVGVILSSSDSGKTWSIIYSDQSSNQFHSIAELNKHKFYVVGDNGIGVIIEKND